jgi:hypothetical protein
MARTSKDCENCKPQYAVYLISNHHNAWPMGLLLWPQSWGNSLLPSKPGSLLRFLWSFHPRLTPAPVVAQRRNECLRSALRCLGSVRLRAVPEANDSHRVALNPVHDLNGSFDQHPAVRPTSNFPGQKWKGRQKLPHAKVAFSPFC